MSADIFDGVDVLQPLNPDCEWLQGAAGVWLPLPWLSGGERLVELVGRKDGVLTNGPTWINSPQGPSLSCDGTNDRVIASGVAASETYLTLIVVGMHTGAGFRAAVSAGAATNNAGPHIAVQSGTTYRYGNWGGLSLDSTVGYAVGVEHVWQNALTPTTAWAGIDGRVAATGSGTFLGTNGSLQIGCLNNLGSHWAGTISAVIVIRGPVSPLALHTAVNDDYRRGWQDLLYRPSRRLVSLPADAPAARRGDLLLLGVGA